MLSGQITPMQVNDAAEGLFDGLEEMLQELVRRNLRLFKLERGVFTLSQEQIAFVEAFANSVDSAEILSFVTQRQSLTVFNKELCEMLLSDARLELKGNL